VEKGLVLAILTVENLSKQYPPPPAWARPLVRVAATKPVKALEPTSFEMDEGEVVGLVGPNGAGKSTLIRLLAGLLEPTGGTVRVDGREQSGSGSSSRVLGLILEGDLGLYQRLTGAQNLEFFGVVNGLKIDEARKRSAHLMSSFDLADKDKLVFGYSSGMKLKLSLARALIANPSIVLLDEPTRSLDPIASAEAGRLLRSLADDGRAILVSSHRIDEVVSVCDRILVLLDGTLRFDGRAEDLETDGSQAKSALLDLLSSGD
jgi:ABC-2 type transport system ATP-binding protein